VVNDVAAERVAEYARSADELDLIARIGVRHALLVPLWGRSGILGAIGLARSGEAPFTNEDAFVAKSLATRAALAFENARLHAATRRLEREWRSLYERHQRILDTAPAQILVINEAGRILSVNRSVRSPDPKTALDANAYDMVVPQDRERVKGIIAESMRSGRHAEYETQAILGPEDVRWFHVRVGPVEIDGEKGAVLVSTDIEDRKRAERELATMRAQLIQGEKLSALGSLVSGVAHEPRTPLTFLSTNAFLLRRQLDEAARLGHLTGDARDGAERFIGEIMAGVDRINQLVEDLRRYTKARHDARLVPRALDEVVGDPIELFRATNRRSHHLESHVTRTRAVHLNVGGVQQIVLNLLQNAADATPPGGVVRVATRDEGDAVVLEVADEGDGIPKEIQERMFEPLFTTKTEGTGLGLSIVKRIVDEHGATISCESQVGKGAIFRVRFPSPKDA
ncbi:MAG TPA: ATP-binding protein, partial [Candidatus Thermoplasmatota archaeon]|nr:ATP-binding protein [Candidatus Thermoplasmatota archaeon]